MSRPVEHIVLLRLKEGLTKEQEADAEEGCYSLKAIPGVLAVSFGVNFSARSAGYTHGLVVRFINKEAGEKYQDHPLHVAYRDHVLKPLFAAESPVLCVDYEINASL